MTYLFSDFYFLYGAAQKGVDTVGDAYERMSSLMTVPVSLPCLLYTIRGLSAGGYVTIIPEDGLITATTPISVTEAGRNAIAISTMQKWLGQAKAFGKNQEAFCSLLRPDTAELEAWTPDEESFTQITEAMMRRGDLIPPLFDLTHVDEDTLTLTLHSAGDYDSPLEGGDGGAYDHADEDTCECSCAVSVTGHAERVTQGLSDLLATTHALLTAPPHTRKIALHGSDKSFVVTLAQAASEYGTVLRMTVAPIRFNRQRFIGKQDGDLDYAQCADPVILREMNGARDFACLILPCAVSLPNQLTAKDVELIGKIRKLLK